MKTNNNIKRTWNISILTLENTDPKILSNEISKAHFFDWWKNPVLKEETSSSKKEALDRLYTVEVFEKKWIKTYRKRLVKVHR